MDAHKVKNLQEKREWVTKEEEVNAGFSIRLVFAFIFDSPKRLLAKLPEEKGSQYGVVGAV